MEFYVYDLGKTTHFNNFLELCCLEGMGFNTFIHFIETVLSFIWKIQHTLIIFIKMCCLDHSNFNTFRYFY